MAFKKKIVSIVIVSMLAFSPKICYAASQPLAWLQIHRYSNSTSMVVTVSQSGVQGFLFKFLRIRSLWTKINKS